MQLKDWVVKQLNSRKESAGINYNTAVNCKNLSVMLCTAPHAEVRPWSGLRSQNRHLLNRLNNRLNNRTKCTDIDCTTATCYCHRKIWVTNVIKSPMRITKPNSTLKNDPLQYDTKCVHHTRVRCRARAEGSILNGWQLPLEYVKMAIATWIQVWVKLKLLTMHRLIF